MPGKSVADFSLPATGGGTFRLSEQRGKKLGPDFYPKDTTPGCTTEGMQFRDLHMNFRRAGCDIYGISRDSLRSHENFKAKLHFPFQLLAVAAEPVCTQFGVIKLKNMYGRQVRGIERSTFVIDGEGRLAREWRGVKVPGPAHEGLDLV